MLDTFATPEFAPELQQVIQVEARIPGPLQPLCIGDKHRDSTGTLKTTPQGIHDVLQRATKSLTGLPRVNWHNVKGHARFGNNAALQIEFEVNQLRQELSLRSQNGYPTGLTGDGLRREAIEYERTAKSLREKEKLSFLLNRVPPEAQRKLLEDDVFLGKFSGPEDCTAFVLSVDIRRSTELLLRARSAAHFAKFLSSFCEEVEAITRQNFGIIDKFTGDGILAFFPDFFSGPDAGYFVLRAAKDCHAAFKACYKEHRSSFTPVLNDVGLGIGIDYGSINLLHLPHGLAIVGGAVVYACRLAGAPPDKTYVNQAALDRIMASYGEICTAMETSLEIKHEGRILCHEMELTANAEKAQPPEWMSGPWHDARLETSR